MLAQDEASTHGGNYGTGDIMAGVIRGGAAVADGALWALGVSVEAARWQLRLIKEVTSWAQQAPAGPVPVPPWPRTMPPPALREALQKADDHIGAGPMSASLPRDGQAAAAQVLMRLAADLSRARQQVSELLHGVEAGRAEPGLAAELPGRVGSVEARLAAAAFQKVITPPRVLVKIASWEDSTISASSLIRSSAALRSLTSRTAAETSSPSLVCSGLRLISTGNSLPSRRKPRRSSPAPMGRTCWLAAYPRRWTG